MSINTGKDVRWWSKLTDGNKLHVLLLWACISLSGVIVYLFFETISGLKKQVEVLEKQNKVKDQALIQCSEEKDKAVRERAIDQQKQIDYLKQQAENKKEAIK